jgi:hypothetical protein
MNFIRTSGTILADQSRGVRLKFVLPEQRRQCS